MDGLEAVELKLSEVKTENIVFRIDNDFFQKKFISISKKFKDNKKLEEFAVSVICGPFGSTILDETYQEEGITVVRPFNLVNYKVENKNLVYISEKDVIAKGLKIFQPGTLLFARVGDIRCGALTYPDVTISPNIIATEIKIDKYSPYFLAIFFNSKFGLLQILREVKVVAQPTISTDTIRRLKVPEVTKSFQKFCQNLMLYAFNIELDSDKFCQQAEELLLSELNLKDWQPTEDNIAVKSFSSSFFASGRLDAEYYHPRVDQLIQRLEEKVELTSLGNLLTVNQRGKQPDYIQDEEEDKNVLPVINSKHVQKGEVILTDNRFATVSDSNNNLTIQKNDVLMNGTGRGTMGRCAPYLYEQPALPDNHVTILRSDSLDPVYLSIYLNSIAGQFQVEKYLKGSSGQLELYPNDICQFLVWVAPDSVQQQIRNKVEESHQKREQSKQLLEIAKTGVEKAIETDEATATAWMNQQLAALGINLESGQ